MSVPRPRPGAWWMAAVAILATGMVGARAEEPVLSPAQEPVTVAATTATDGLDDRAVLNPLAEIGLESLTGFRDRPLFSPGRRPPAPPEPEPEPEPVAMVEEPDGPAPEPEVGMPMVALAGILEVDSDRVAMLRDMNTATTLSVRVGDPVEGWTVAAIGGDSITLEHDGEQHEIRIFQPGADGPSGTGAAGDAIDPETGEPLGPGGEFGGGAMVRPPRSTRMAVPAEAPSQDQLIDPGDPAAIDENGDSVDNETFEGESYEGESFEGDMPLDAATDGDVQDAADGVDPSAGMDSDDDFGGDDLDGDGFPDADRNPGGGG